MRVAVIGARGQLGSDLMRTLEDPISLTHDEIEVVDPSSCEKLRELDPDAVVNTAAYHRTDDCEDHPDLAFAVNAIGALNVARVADSIGAINVYISTDYVFSGESGHYYEDDPVRPINVYGASKIAGEVLTRAYSSRHYIFRVSSLFGTSGARGKGGNFVETMISKARRGEKIGVVNDVVFSPTYTLDAAAAIDQVLRRGLHFGTFHVTNQGSCSWYEFAVAIFDILGMRVMIEPLDSSQYPTRARRPPDSSLSSCRMREEGIPMRNWKDALRAYLVEKGHLS